MKILAIETATPASSVAIGDGRSLEALSVRVDRRGHVGFVVDAIEFCLEKAGWKAGELDLVAVDVGPGLFTGIRAGLSTGQGIAAAAGVPLVPITAVDALALRASTGHRRIWSVVDVRRGQVAVAPYQPVPGGVVKDGPIELASPEEFRGLLNADPSDALVVGDWQALPEAARRGMGRARWGRPRYPSAETLLELARMRADRDDYPAQDAIRPVYLRSPDVDISWSEFREEGLWPDSAST